MKKNCLAITKTTAICASTPGFPVSHHCYKYPLAKMFGGVIFCYTPGYLRKLMSNIVENRKGTGKNEK